MSIIFFFLLHPNPAIDSNSHSDIVSMSDIHDNADIDGGTSDAQIR